MSQGENPVPEWKVRIMKNNKTEYPGVVESVSRFAGAFVGTLVVGSKEMVNGIKEITKPKLELKPEPMPKPIPKPEPKASTKVAEKPVKSLPEKKISPAVKVKKKTTAKQANVKKKVKKPKNSSRS